MADFQNVLASGFGMASSFSFAWPPVRRKCSGRRERKRSKTRLPDGQGKGQPCKLLSKILHSSAISTEGGMKIRWIFKRFEPLADGKLRMRNSSRNARSPLTILKRSTISGLSLIFCHHMLANCFFASLVLACLAGRQDFLTSSCKGSFPRITQLDNISLHSRIPVDFCQEKDATISHILTHISCCS